jgi:hypothetical protein
LATASAQVTENNNVSEGESPGDRSVLLLSPISVCGNPEGRLEKRSVVESASAVMHASMALNWFQLRTGFDYC